LLSASGAGFGAKRAESVDALALTLPLTGSNGDRLCCGVNAHVLGRNWKRPEAPLELFTEVGW